MSVMMFSDPKGYARLGNSILKNQKLFRCWEKVYSDEMPKLLYGMYLANLRSYNKRYREDGKPFYSEEDFIKAVKACNEEYQSIYQLLKSLHCLDYQIEVDLKDIISLEERRGIEFLKSVIRTVEWYFFEQSGDYDKADWAI